VSLGIVLVISTAADVGEGAENEKGKSEAPLSAVSLAGPYCRGKGLAYALELTLLTNGDYSAKWDSCLYKSGQANGRWSFSAGRVTFAPAMEGEMLPGGIQSAQVLKFKGEWILLPTDEQSRKLYEEQGVTTSIRSSSIKGWNLNGCGGTNRCTRRTLSSANGKSGRVPFG
jgi:hypothetical protein